MKSTFLSLFALAVAAVSAAPTLLSTMHPTPVSAACNGLAPGATDEVNNFKLAAFYTSKTNANATGVPLVVGQDGGGDGLEFKVLSTYATYPYNEFPNFSIFEGSLFASGPGENDAVANAPIAGQALALYVPPQGPADRVFCAAVGDDGFSHLAANGDADSFFLCSGTPHSQVSVVYKPTDEARCDAVVLHIVNA